MHPLPDGSNYYANVTDPSTGFTQSGWSYAAVLDTGSSGSVICQTEALGRNLQNVSGTYQDQGIGGQEYFNISVPTTVKLAAIDSGAVTVNWNTGAVTEYPAMFNSCGDYNLQVRQSDPVLDTDVGPTTVMINTVGTPVLNQYAMHVKSQASPFAYQMDSWGMVPVNYVPTELVAPSTLVASNVNTGGSQLVLVPAGSTTPLHVPLLYQDYVDHVNNPTAPPPSVATNPTIPGVIAQLQGHNPVTSTWLLDSGSAVTMIGRDLATSLGIDINVAGVTSTTVLGIGSTGGTAMVTFQGYDLSTVTLSTTEGVPVVFHNLVVFVPGAGDLPADFPGILGMNLLNHSFSGLTSDLFDIIETDPDGQRFQRLVRDSAGAGYSRAGHAGAAGGWSGGVWAAAGGTAAAGLRSVCTAGVGRTSFPTRPDRWTSWKTRPTWVSAAGRRAE